MKKSRLTDSFKEMRNGQTQEQLAMELNVSRESISKYENGHVRLPQDIARNLMAKHDNPRFALAVRSQYTKTGPIWLDGPNVDLHRSAVKEKTLEEIKEVSEAIKAFSFAQPFTILSSWQLPQVEKLLEETAEAITALEHLTAIVCEEANISYNGVWQKHHTQMRAKGYVQ
ncbi:helix-turn-helix domain-containing protein [Planococcus sp. A6]|uniref:helix-turn-helix domain-containing protein n=1 Tax=Planococcus sp. A6 TaxID=2992760 RepID=UPI00237C4A45|nr:helix-turn-helix transcriptional regulator [Planococcus sp. A6]MDE0581519.1 helix-turn-helix domain-containing protein [Planococcus sp. A6]